SLTPPVASRLPSGEKATAPRARGKVRSSFPVPASHSRTSPPSLPTSRHAAATRLPSGETATASTPFAASVRLTSPVAGSSNTAGPPEAPGSHGLAVGREGHRDLVLGAD